MAVFTRTNIILAISILLFSIFLFNPEKQYFAEREMYCIELIRAGALYGGQTLCGNPPLSYYTGYALSIFFENHLQTATFVLITALSGAIIILLCNYLKPSTISEHAFLLIFALFLLAYSTLDFATTLSMFFVFTSFYIIRTQNKQKYSSHSSRDFFLAGGFYALAVSSKVISILFLPLFIAFIFYELFCRKKLFFKQAVKSAVIFLTPTAGLSILLHLAYPFLPFYVFSAHTILHPHWTFFGSVIYAMNNFNLQHFIIIFINIIAAILLLRREIDAIFLLPLAFWHIYLTKSNSIFETGEPLFMSFFTYYFLIFFPFLFIALFSIARKAKQKKSNTILHNTSLLAFIVFFVYFGLYLSPAGLRALSYQPIPERPAEIQNLLDTFYQNFTYDTGMILVNKKHASIIPESLAAQLRFSDFSSAIRPEDFGYGDPNYGPGIKKLPIYNSSAYNPKLIKDKSDFALKLSSTLTALNTTNSTFIMSDYETILLEKVLKQSYCHVFVPILLENKNGIHHVNYFYKNKTLCTTAKQKVHNFISSNFNTFCSFDEKIADEYAPITKSNGARFEKTCSSGAKGYDPEETRTDTASLIVLMLFVVLTAMSLATHRI